MSGLSDALDKYFNQDGESEAYAKKMREIVREVLKPIGEGETLNDLWRRRAIDSMRQKNKRTFKKYGLVQITTDTPTTVTFTVHMVGRETFTDTFNLPNDARASF